jgi:hypothetical protein
MTSSEPDREPERIVSTSKLVTVARYVSVVFVILGLVLGLASGWCALGISQMRCGPDTPEPHTGLYLLLMGVPALASWVGIVLVRRAFRIRTGAAAMAALIGAIVGCGVAAGAALFGALVAMSC